MLCQERNTFLLFSFRTWFCLFRMAGPGAAAAAPANWRKRSAALVPVVATWAAKGATLVGFRVRGRKQARPIRTLDGERSFELLGLLVAVPILVQRRRLFCRRPFGKGTVWRSGLSQVPSLDFGHVEDTSRLEMRGLGCTLLPNSVRAGWAG